jgi:hypothetical protein
VPVAPRRGGRAPRFSANGLLEVSANGLLQGR